MFRLCFQYEIVHIESGDLLGYRRYCGGGRVIRVLFAKGSVADKGNESTPVRGECGNLTFTVSANREDYARRKQCYPSLLYSYAAISIIIMNIL